MHRQKTTQTLIPVRYSSATSLKGLTMALTGFIALHASYSVMAQDLEAEPLFGSTSLEAGFATSPFTVQVSPGGTDEAFNLGGECYGYMRFAQPDFVLNYQAGTSPLGVFAISDLDITMAINDPAGNWHCNDDSNYLSGTNSGIQFSAPVSGNYQIWVGSYDSGAESIATMLAITEADESEWASLPIGLEDVIYAASFDLNGDILFGDDSSPFANDGECDDPRFQGPGAAFGSSTEHIFKDASDCRSQFEANLVSLAEPDAMNLGGDMDFALGDSDLFGGDISAGSPLAMPDAGPFGEVMFALVQAFQAIPGDNAGAMPMPFGLGGDTASSYDRTTMTELTGIDFGDNSGLFADDGECDDPRFEGPGTSGIAFDDTEFTDAADCSNLYLAGSVTYIDPLTSDDATRIEPGLIVDSSGINFGDNSSVFADDGECDDPRFEGPGAAAFTSEENELRDANDCRNMFESGQLSLLASANAAPVAPPASSSTNTRTSQTMPAASQEEYTVGVPRGDIDGATQADGSIFASGTVYGDPLGGDGDVNGPNGGRIGMPANVSPATARPASTSAIDFGDNSSDYANDNECDDPRFEGSGMAVITFDDDLGRDANDCRAAYESGTITLIGN